jgi:hypothetical protein
MEDKMEAQLYSDNNKEKMNTYKCNIQEFWETIKVSTLLNIHVKEALQIVSRHDQKRTTPHHIITKYQDYRMKKGY